jgi:hypothetical protein
VGQILDVKPILVFDHIPQDKTKGIFLHHLVKSSLMKREKIGREEEAIRRILSEELYPPHPQHRLHRGGILQGDGLDRFDLFGEVLNFLFKGLDLSENLFQFHSKPAIEMEALSDLDRLHILLMGDPTADLRIFIGLVFRPILIHDVDIRVNRDLLGDKL